MEPGVSRSTTPSFMSSSCSVIERAFRLWRFGGRPALKPGIAAKASSIVRARAGGWVGRGAGAGIGTGALANSANSAFSEILEFVI